MTMVGFQHIFWGRRGEVNNPLFFSRRVGQFRRQGQGQGSHRDSSDFSFSRF